MDVTFYLRYSRAVFVFVILLIVLATFLSPSSAVLLKIPND